MSGKYITLSTTRGNNMKQDSRLILALDVTEEEKALTIAKEVGSIVDAVKVGYLMRTRNGL
jgi:orotidine-5'-phosphate decarboxylase